MFLLLRHFTFIYVFILFYEFKRNNYDHGLRGLSLCECPCVACLGLTFFGVRASFSVDASGLLQDYTLAVHSLNSRCDWCCGPKLALDNERGLHAPDPSSCLHTTNSRLLPGSVF